jgi:hypothetical protein
VLHSVARKVGTGSSILVVSLLVWCACGAPARSPAELREATRAEVEPCEPLGTIEEEIESPTEADDLGERARAAVRGRAAELGASHLVFDLTETELTYARVRAEAFRCR